MTNIISHFEYSLNLNKIINTLDFYESYQKNIFLFSYKQIFITKLEPNEIK